MKIQILEFLRGAEKATGLTVIIDVFRAFSTSCYIFNNGAEKIIPVGDLKLAYKLKRENPHFLLFGERGGKKPEGFDFGNSPSEIEGLDFSGVTILLTTSSGTQGLVKAKNGEEIITGSFVNAGAIVKYIKTKNPNKVSLVAMGVSGRRRALEDLLCAEYIENTLTDRPNNFEEITRRLRVTPELQKFFDPKKYWFPERDFKLCLSLKRFSFILKLEPFEENLVCLKRIDV